MIESYCPCLRCHQTVVVVSDAFEICRVRPDGRVISPWWRQRDHVLAMGDLAEVMAAQPEVLVAGFHLTC